MLVFYCGELLLLPPRIKAQDHPLSAVGDFLFNIFAAVLLIWRLSSTSGCFLNDGHSNIERTYQMKMAVFWVVAP
jgi:hypothetical protein